MHTNIEEASLATLVIIIWSCRWTRQVQIQTGMNTLLHQLYTECVGAQMEGIHSNFNQSYILTTHIVTVSRMFKATKHNSLYKKMIIAIRFDSTWLI